MSWRKKAAACVLAAALALTASGALAAEGRTEIYVNGKRAAFTDRAFEEAGRLLVPVRAFGERLGAEVLWDAASETVTLLRAPYEARMTVGSTGAVRGGQPVELDAPPQLVGGSVYIPLRFAADCLGAKVDYDPAADCAFVDFEAKRGNRIGNPGNIAQDENWIYVSTYDSGMVWKVDRNTHEPSVFIRCLGSGLNVMDGWVYANLSNSRNPYYKNIGVCKVRPDGSDFQIISKHDFYEMQLVNNRIVGSLAGVGPCSMDLSGNDFRVVSEFGFEDLKTTDGYIYAINDKIRRLDLENGAIETVLDKPYNSLQPDGDYLYYLDITAHLYPYEAEHMSTLYRKNLTAESKPEVVNHDAFSYNISDGYVYFTRFSAYTGVEPGIWRMPVDGGEMVRITDLPADVFSVFEENLYFVIHENPLKLVTMKTDGSDVSYIELTEQ